MILNSGDWGSFTFIMCDLMFLWRKLQCNNAMELIRLYDQAAVALSAKVFPFCAHNKTSMITHGLATGSKVIGNVFA